MPSACVILHLNCCPAADASLFLKQTEGSTFWLDSVWTVYVDS